MTDASCMALINAKQRMQTAFFFGFFKLITLKRMLPRTNTRCKILLVLMIHVHSWFMLASVTHPTCSAYTGLHNR